MNLYFHARGLTALHASSEEVSELTKKSNQGQNEGDSRILQSQEASSSGTIANSPTSGSKPKYNFICECFFMTARVLNLGLLKAFSDFKHLVQVMIINDVLAETQRSLILVTRS